MPEGGLLHPFVLVVVLVIRRNKPLERAEITRHFHAVPLRFGSLRLYFVGGPYTVVFLSFP